MRTRAPRRVDAGPPPWLQNHTPGHAQGVSREAFDRVFAARARSAPEAAARRVCLARSRERQGVHAERAGGPDEALLRILAASGPILRKAIVG